MASLVVCGLSVTPYVSLLAEPALPAWHEVGTQNGPDSALFANQGDIFQGGLDSPPIEASSFTNILPEASDIVPAVAPVIAPAQVQPNVGAVIGQFQPVGGLVANGGNGAGAGVGQAIQNGAQIVGGIAAVGSVVGQIQNGNAGGGLGNFGPKQPGDLSGILQGLNGGAGVGAGPFGAVLGQGNQYLQTLALLATLQQLLAGNQASFSNTNTGQSAKSAHTNLMQVGIDDTSNTLSDLIDTSPPPATSCGAPTNLTAAQKERWNAQFNRMNRLIKGSALEGYVPADGAKHGITTGSSEEWAAFYANLGVQESGNQNQVVGDEGRFVGNSNGIYQLSPLDYANYRGDMEKAGLTPGTTIDGKPAFTIEQLRDPEINSRATIAISERLIKQDGAIGGNSTTGMAKYWGPLRRGWTACS
jgi:hypothetical protein